MVAALGRSTTDPASSLFEIREIRSADVEACAVAAYAAHSRVAAAHNVPCEHPSVEFSMGLVGNKVKDPNAIGFVAERSGHILGSVFLNIFPNTPAAAIGPLTVDPAAEGSEVGQRLMHAAMNAARNRSIDQIRLVQSPSHLRSLALYGKLGFEVREYAGGGYGFATRDGIDLHLGEDPRKEGRMRAYLYVDDADALAAEWRAAGVEVHGPEDTEWGMREGAMVDPDDNVIRFGSPLTR